MIGAFISEIAKNPKDAWQIIKIIVGAFVLLIFGCIGMGIHECGKKVLDKFKKE